MIVIRFDDTETEKEELDFLAGRYFFKTWANGDLMAPEPASGQLAVDGITFRVRRPASDEHFRLTVRNPAPAAVTDQAAR